MSIRPISFSIENYMRVKLAEITFGENGEVIWIGGENDQGKSSCLNAIEDAFSGGRKNKDFTPIHDGANKAVIIGKLQTDSGELILKKVYTESGARLELLSGEGAKFSSPQAKLDEFLGSFIDPESMIGMSPKERKELMLSIVDIGIDLQKWECDRLNLFNERTAVNRDIKTLEGKCNVPDKDALLKLPEEHESVIDIIDEKNSTQMWTAKQQQICSSLDYSHKKIFDYEKRIHELEVALDEERVRFKALEVEISEHDKTAGDWLPISEYDERIKNVSDLNSQIDKANALRENLEELKKEKTKSFGITEEINMMDRTRDDALRNAKWPVEGLGIGEEDITHNGIPFSQLSTSKRLMLGMEIGRSEQEDLKLLIMRSANSLDASNRKVVEQWAEENDYYILAEIVGTEGADIIIEDGVGGVADGNSQGN